MIDEGHTVGNHTCNHKNMPSLSLEEQTNEIMVLHNLVKDNFGYEMKLFRFPEGSTSEQSLGLVESLRLPERILELPLFRLRLRCSERSGRDTASFAWTASILVQSICFMQSQRQTHRSLENGSMQCAPQAMNLEVDCRLRGNHKKIP